MSTRELQQRLKAPLGYAIALCATLLVSPLSADDGKPRYVSGSGKDSGDCLNKFRPCRSLDYAIAQAGKADYIRVAEGDYAIDDAQKLATLLSANGRITGGYAKYSAYSEQSASTKTLLIGVPPEFRERFQQAGFTVIVDRKGITAEETRQMRRLTTQILATEQSHASAPCISNLSEGYPCHSVSLLSHLSLADLRPSSARGNDVWGFTDLNTQREYVVMGLQRGVSILDVTDPESPLEVGIATGSSTTWRDIKIYQRYDAAAKRWRAYAYVTADAVSDFLMVLDLSDLPNAIEVVSFSSDFTAAHNAYIVNADYTYGVALTSQTPRLGIAGGGNSGAQRLYSLAQPRSPSLSTVTSTGYAHDLASHAVRDARKDSQCVNAQSEPACHVVSDFNENTVDIWDVTNPNDMRALASVSYPNAAYVHSGWWTEDGRYLLVHDELDESNYGLNTTVRVLDMSDLRAPTLAGSWVGPTRAIDHNGFVRGNRYYIANYAEGLTVLDITVPASPQRVGYFDTYPSSAQSAFVGAWGVYPFFASGTIAVADINTGLYLLKDETLASPNGALAFAGSSHFGSEGESVTLSVSRTGGAENAVSVQLELLHGSTQANDVSISAEQLSWAPGDTSNKSVTLSLNTDAESESMELLMVRLKSPTGGATVSYPDTARVHIADAGASPRLRLLDSSISVDQRRGVALLSVTRLDSADGEARLSYRTLPSTSYDGFVAAEGELVWASGDPYSKSVQIELNPTALPAGQNGTFTVEFSNAVGADLETQSGATATDVLAEVSVRNSTSPANPNPPPPPGGSGGGGGGGGGGSTSVYVWLALLGFGAARRAYPALARISHRAVWRERTFMIG